MASGRSSRSARSCSRSKTSSWLLSATTSGRASTRSCSGSPKSTSRAARHRLSVTLPRVGGLLLHGDTERSAALRHEIPIAIIDSLLFAEVDGRRYVLTTHLESERIQELLPDAELLDYFALGYKELVQNGMSFEEASLEVEARAVREIGIQEAIVPGEFPLALGDRLRQDGVALTIDDAAVKLRRRAKAPAELEGIRAAQRAAEAGMSAAAGLLTQARPAGDRLEGDGK